MKRSSKRLTSRRKTVAYFSMEIAVDPNMPTYSGGLGILAGDTLRAAADIGLPMVAVTLLHRKGYFRQHLDEQGNQTESPAFWKPEEHLEQLPLMISVTVEGRPIHLRVWKYKIVGAYRWEVPVYLLDSSVSDNRIEDQGLTDYLYGGDIVYRLKQELVLGLGGAELIKALNLRDGALYHMNEGHSAFLCVALLEDLCAPAGIEKATKEQKEKIRQTCVFTTHTPVPAGHDQFPIDLVSRTLGESRLNALKNLGVVSGDKFNMTELALEFSDYINGVAMRHGQISRDMFPNYPVSSITNGVHGGTWVSAPFSALFDRHIPGWKADSLNLRYAVGIPLSQILDAHFASKELLVHEVNKRCGIKLNPHTFTIGFARRATPYKRATLLFQDIQRLQEVAEKTGPIQIIFGGKAHPQDDAGKHIIRQIHEAARAIKEPIEVIYLEEYDWNVARYLCAGVDLWLNTPKPPNEASGTSGMKAAINGIPSLSVLDGWWIEGHVEGVTGWAIEAKTQTKEVMEEVESIYAQLQFNIIPMFYNRPLKYAKVMRMAIALNGSFFNSQRMLIQYLNNAY